MTSAGNSPLVGHVKISFATIVHEGEEVGSEHASIEPIKFGASSFPVLLQDVQTVNDLTQFQSNHFHQTYAHYGINMQQVVAYSIYVFDEGTDEYEMLGICENQEQWNTIVEKFNLLLHKRADCPAASQCSLCTYTPWVVVCMDKEHWEAGLADRPRFSHGIDIVLRDEASPEYAARLLSIDRALFEQYNNLFSSARAQLGLEQAVRKPSSNDGPQKPSRDPDDSDSDDGDPGPSKPKTRRPGKATSKNDQKGQDKPDYITGPKGSHKIYTKVIEPTKSKEKDWSRGRPKPAGTAKTPDEECLTCIHHGRKCNGTVMVESTNKRGETVTRCENCAKNNRTCYWQDLTRAIRTYEDAQQVLDGYRCAGNTRQGRAIRALNRLSLSVTGDQEDAAVDDGNTEVLHATNDESRDAESADPSKQDMGTADDINEEELAYPADDEE